MKSKKPKTSRPLDKGIMQEARKLASLQHQRRRLRAELRRIEQNIRTQKRHLMAIIQARDDDPDWHESGAASKVLGSRAGD